MLVVCPRLPDDALCFDRSSPPSCLTCVSAPPCATCPDRFVSDVAATACALEPGSFLENRRQTSFLVCMVELILCRSCGNNAVHAEETVFAILQCNSRKSEREVRANPLFGGDDFFSTVRVSRIVVECGRCCPESAFRRGLVQSGMSTTLPSMWTLCVWPVSSGRGSSWPGITSDGVRAVLLRPSRPGRRKKVVRAEFPLVNPQSMFQTSASALAVLDGALRHPPLDVCRKAASDAVLPCLVLP